MFPLSVITIGCDSNAHRELAVELDRISANWEADFSEVDPAVEACRQEASHPRLIIFQLDRPDQLPGLRLVTSRLPNWPTLALIPDPSQQAIHGNPLFIPAMRGGASQVVLRPLQAEDFRAALEVIARQVDVAPALDRERSGQTIALAGVTGGAGSTTLAINLADLISTRPHTRVVLVDLSLKMGAIALNLNVEPTYTILDLLPKASSLDAVIVQSVLIPISEGFDLLAGPHFTISNTETVPDQILQIVEVVRQLADVIVLDIPCTFDDLYFRLIHQSDHIVLVGEQKVPSIRALKMVRETVREMDPESEPVVVINRYDSRVPSFGSRRLADVLGLPEVLTVVNDYNAASNSLNTGRTIRRETPKSRILPDVEVLAEQILGPVAEAGLDSGNGPPVEKPQSLLKKFRGSRVG